MHTSLRSHQRHNQSLPSGTLSSHHTPNGQDPKLNSKIVRNRPPHLPHLGRRSDNDAKSSIRRLSQSPRRTHALLCQHLHPMQLRICQFFHSRRNHHSRSAAKRPVGCRNSDDSTKHQLHLPSGCTEQHACSFSLNCQFLQARFQGYCRSSQKHPNHLSILQ